MTKYDFGHAEVSTWWVRDPFAGEIEITGGTFYEALLDAYADIDPPERPTHVWVEGEKVDVPRGVARPLE